DERDELLQDLTMVVVDQIEVTVTNELIESVAHIAFEARAEGRNILVVIELDIVACPQKQDELKDMVPIVALVIPGALPERLGHGTHVRLAEQVSGGCAFRLKERVDALRVLGQYYLNESLTG